MTSLLHAIAIVVILAVVGIRPEVEWARSPSAAVVVMAGPGDGARGGNGL